MHVLEPKEIAKRSKRHQNRKKTKGVFLTFMFVVLAAGGGGAWYVLNGVSPSPATPSADSQSKPEEKTTEPAAQTPKTKVKTFTGAEFRDLYRSITYPNTEAFSIPPEITGNKEADARIRSLAEKRGFILTSIPVSPIEKSGEELTGSYQDDLLQTLAAMSWQQLKTAAKAEGLGLSMVSGYRSPKSQRELFTERLYSTGITDAQIANGTGDNAVNLTLSMTAVPGYSRHHTGYTIDIHCDDGVAFGNSVCNKWITKDNYLNAKKFGWIPSYPPGAGEQGPEPEAWEYVWVGTDVLYE